MTNRGELGRSRGFGGRIRTLLFWQGTYAFAFTVIRQLLPFGINQGKNNYVLITEEIGWGDARVQSTQ